VGSRYLTDLAAVIRATGLEVIEVSGWQTRARGSGGYDSGRPNHVMIHHTASPASADGWPDVNYCTYHDEDAPLCNLYLNRGGIVWVCAAGATNTNGSGRDPCGVTPDDSMNSHAIGIEAGNNGTGELWPDAQENAYLVLVEALGVAYGIPVGRVHAHAEYAPTRKVDPAGPDRWATGAATWNMHAFRGDLIAPVAPIIPEPEPEPPPEDVMPMFIAQDPDDSDNYATGDGLWRREWNGPNWHDELRQVINDRNRAGTPIVDLKTGKPVTSLVEVTAASKWGARLGVSINDALD
jgi:hypothetical protein